MTETAITYYKIISNYPNDYTKRCNLTGEEIDNNFFFLRSFDISGGTLDENGNIILYRLDNEESPIVINIKDYIKEISGDIEVDGFFDVETGILTLKINGESIVIEGFNNKITELSSITHTIDCKINDLNDGVSACCQSVSTLETNLNEEISRAKSAETINRKAIENEENRAKSVENRLNDRINEIVSSSTEHISEIENKLNKEIEERQSEDTEIRNTLETAITEEKQARETADNELSNRIGEEAAARIASDEELNNSIGNEVQARENADNEIRNAIESAITEESQTRENADNEIKSKIEEEKQIRESAITEEAQARDAADNEIKEKIKDLYLTEDIVISKYNPLYYLVKDIWENDTILSGTTFTEFVKTLFTTEDKNMLYFISSEKRFNNFVKNSRLDISTFESARIIEALKDGSNIELNAGDITQIIVMPSNRNLLEASIIGNIGNRCISDLDAEDFELKIMPLQIGEGEYIDKVHNVYVYETKIGLAGQQTLNIKIG